MNPRVVFGKVQLEYLFRFSSLSFGLLPCGKQNDLLFFQNLFDCFTGSEDGGDDGRNPADHVITQ